MLRNALFLPVISTEETEGSDLVGRNPSSIALSWHDE